ncbi:hypothetical protein FRC12_015714 [Ceratobasidium sp. 428]|nr:hypothetical protein FRC12_015714 [Ceratobasidium sp. 428]
MDSRPLSTVSSIQADAAPAYEDLGLGTSSREREDQVNVVHAYSAFVGNAMIDIVIRIYTPKESRDSTLTLTCQAGGVERVIGEPQTLQLPRPSQAEFAIYFIPRESSPLNALHKLRIWLTTPGLQVRLWAEDEFWVGAQLPFPAIPGAHLARLVHSSPLFHIYHGSAGGAALSYTVSMDPVPYAVTGDEYLISLRYEAGGINIELCSNLRVRLSCDIHDVSFII